MACADIEDLILNNSGWEPGQRQLVEAHVRGCEDCLAFLEAAQSIDFALEQTRRAPARLTAAVLAAIAPKPSYLPEILDFVGWAAMISVAVGLVRELLATY